MTINLYLRQIRLENAVLERIKTLEAMFEV